MSGTLADQASVPPGSRMASADRLNSWVGPDGLETLDAGFALRDDCVFRDTAFPTGAQAQVQKRSGVGRPVPIKLRNAVRSLLDNRGENARYFGIALLATAFSAGCSSSRVSPPATVTPSSYVSNLDLRSQRALDSANLATNTIFLYVLERKENSGVLTALAREGCDVQVGILRNPGGAMLFVRARHGRLLTTADRVELSRLVSSLGATVVKGNRLPYLRGPDGRTPMLMRNPAQYPSSETEPMKAILEFKDAQVAREVMRYIDKKSFHIRQKGSRIHLSFTGSTYLIVDEPDILQTFCKHFGGKVQSVTTESGRALSLN